MSGGLRKPGRTVVIVGSGGREHALAWQLARSPQVSALYAAPGNAGLGHSATRAPVAADDVEGQVRLALEVGADLVVIGPEAPLALGLVDALQRAGVPALGPTRAAAQLESSKRFAKEVMRAAGVPTAAFRPVDQMALAEALIDEYFAHGCWLDDDAAGGTLGAPGRPLVVKADGLAAGKGVVICQTRHEATQVTREMLSGAVLAGAGATVVLEECLTGPEVSLLAFCDGERAVPMPLVRDYKRLLDGDLGPNTGGMGSVSPVPGTDSALQSELLATCVSPVLAEMARRGQPFRGVLFTGIMLTSEGPRVLEYNVRFGDPETQTLMRRFQGDLYAVLHATAVGSLTGAQLSWADDAACCVVVAAPGYPAAPVKGLELGTLPAAAGTADPVMLFHGGTDLSPDGRLVTAGGRVLSVTATGVDLPTARQRAYAAAAEVALPGGVYRTDIGAAAEGSLP